MNGAIGEQAGETTPARVEQTLFAFDVEIRILLAGEARRRQVLGGRRAPHSETHLLAVLLLELAVGVQNLGGQIVREPGAVDDLTGALAFTHQRADVGRVQPVELGMQTVPGTGLVQHVAIRLSGDGESVREAEALPGQLLEHLAQRRVLSADERHIVDAELLKKADVLGCTHDLSSHSASSYLRHRTRRAPHAPSNSPGSLPDNAIRRAGTRTIGAFEVAVRCRTADSATTANLPRRHAP